MSESFIELLSENGGSAFARQLAFDDYLDSDSCSMDLEEGTVTLGTETFSMQLLGTEMEERWEWAWSQSQEQAEGGRHRLLQCAQNVRQIGEELGCSFLINPDVDLRQCSSFALSLLASELVGGHVFVQFPTAAGGVTVLLEDAPEELGASVSVGRAITVLTEMTSRFDLDQERFLCAFLEGQGFGVSSVGQVWMADRDGERLMVRMSGDQGIESVNVSQVTQAAWWRFWAGVRAEIS